MITTRWAPRTRRYLAAAFVLSALVHLFGGMLWARAIHLVMSAMHRLPEQHQTELVATSDVVRLEKRNVPRPARRSRQRVPRQAQRSNAQNVAPAPIAVTPRPSRVQRNIVRHAPRAHSAAPPAQRKAALTAQQIAALDAQFAKTIAASKTDLATIQKRSEERPVATIRRPLQFTGMQANLTRGEGYISPTTIGQRVGGSMVYYTHYTYMWPDGHIEDDDIPWPFRFPVQHDLFALHVKLIPLQLPPPGFHLTRPLKPFLARFLRTAARS